MKTQLLTGRNLALFSTMILGVSAFSTWGSVLMADVSQNTQVSIIGIEGKDGILILSMTILAFLLLIIKRVPIWIPLILGILTLTVGLIDFYSMGETTAKLGGNVGAGIYLSILASIGIVTGAIIQLTQDKKK